MSEVEAEGLLLDSSIRMKDVVVYGASFYKDVSVIGGEPVEVVDGLVAGEHVVDLALDGELMAVDNGGLGGGTDEAEVAGFFGQRLEIEVVDDLLSTSVRVHRSGGDSLRGQNLEGDGSEKNEWEEDEGQALHAGKGTAFLEKIGTPLASTLRIGPTPAKST